MRKSADRVGRAGCRWRKPNARACLFSGFFSICWCFVRAWTFFWKSPETRSAYGGAFWLKIFKQQ